MKKIFSILQFLFFAGSLGYFIFRTRSLDANFKIQIEQLRLMQSYYEQKTQWMLSMKDKILNNYPTPISEITLTRILAATWENCKKYGISKEIFLSLIEQESQFNPHADGNDGEIGLCQIMPETAKLIVNSYNLPIQSQSEIHIIENNIEIAVLYLKDLLQIYDLKRALAHYNNGHKGMSGRGKKYAEKVLWGAKKYEL